MYALKAPGKTRRKEFQVHGIIFSASYRVRGLFFSQSFVYRIASHILFAYGFLVENSRMGEVTNKCFMQFISFPRPTAPTKYAHSMFYPYVIPFRKCGPLSCVDVVVWAHYPTVTAVQSRLRRLRRRVPKFQNGCIWLMTFFDNLKTYACVFIMKHVCCHPSFWYVLCSNKKQKSTTIHYHHAVFKLPIEISQSIKLSTLIFI